MASRAVIVAFLATALLGLGTTAGCAPLNASTAITAAESAEEQAKLALAHKNAPYDYYLARAYLMKAKRTNGYSEFFIAETYGDRATELFRKAVQQGRENVMRMKILQQRTQKTGGGGK